MMVVGAGIVCAAAAAVSYGTGDSDKPYLVDADAPPVPLPREGVAATSVSIRTTPAPAETSRRSLPVQVRPRAGGRRARPIRSVVRLGWTARPDATYYVVRIRRARVPATRPVLEL